MVVARTQSGKTGSMCATIKKYLEDTGNIIPVENIYVITGLSSDEWKEQTRERMPDSLQKRVYHRPNLRVTFAEEIKEKKNVLIIMDKIHVTAKNNQTIHKMFESAGLLDKSLLYKNDIKILEYTATPDGTIYDLMKWKDASAKILGDVGDGYTSSHDLLKMGRVKQYKELCVIGEEKYDNANKIYENIKEIKTDIDKYSETLYHIIRTKNGSDQENIIENFKKLFGNNYNFYTYDGTSEIKDINRILSTKPEKHSFIFIKEMIRCAKTLEKKYIGILYERYTKNPDDGTIIQGLLGRDTGYNNNGKSIIYTNIDTIVRYEKLWESGFEKIDIKWNSKTTTYKNGLLLSKKTFNDTKNFDGFDKIDDVNQVKQYRTEIFKTIEEAKKYYKEHKSELGNGCGPRKRSTNEEGFYECTVGKKRDKMRVRSTDEIKSISTWNFGKKENSRLWNIYPCYENINDNKTLQWWLIIKLL